MNMSTNRKWYNAKAVTTFIREGEVVMAGTLLELDKTAKKQLVDEEGLCVLEAEASA